MDSKNKSKSKTKSKSQPISKSISKSKSKQSKSQKSSVMEIVPYTDDNVVSNATAKLDHWMKPNRQGYTEFINQLFSNYYDENKDNNGNLFPHQQLVKNYLAGQFLSPIRGLLVFHTLGSGKSRTAVTVINALFYQKKIIVLTPASLKPNFQQEIMSFGLEIFRLENNWVFVDQSKTEETEFKNRAIKLNIPLKVIKKNGGFWEVKELAKKDKTTNYYSLNDEQQEQIKYQISIMMEQRIQFMSYNGIRKKKLDELPKDFFHNALIVVDEVHNLVRSIINGSRIINYLYQLLMCAKNSKFVLLSATPIINKPAEISYLINLLHGYTNVLSVSFTLNEKKTLLDLEKTLNSIPYIDFYDLYPSTGKIDIKFTPYGYITNVSKGKGIEYLKKIPDTNTNKQVFNQIREVVEQLSEVITINFKKCSQKLIIMDDQEEFDNLFVDYENLIIKNKDALTRRMIGAVSYYNIQDPAIYPEVKPLTLVNAYMSDYQYTKYTVARDIERESEIKAQQMKGKALDDNQVSVYKTFSRLTSDFSFPEELARPFPSSLRQMKQEMENEEEEDKEFESSKKLEDKSNSNSNASKNNTIDKMSKYDSKKKEQMKKIKELGVAEAYQQQIQELMDTLSKNKTKYLHKDILDKYSPKYSLLIQNLEKYQGSHLIYSQFRSVEGLGVLKLALQANGYGILKVKGNKLDIDKEDLGKPLVVEYDSQDKENSEILKSLYNNRPQQVNSDIVNELLKHYPKSNMENFNRDGQMIKIILIGVSGTEGLSLRNCKYVHILESYFNNVRIQQIIGRAKRAKSHEEQPLDQRFVQPFMYISKFTQKQLDLKDHGITQRDNGETSDQTLLQIAQKKEILIDQIHDILSSVSIDCNIQKTSLNQKNRICYKTTSNVGLEDTLYKMNLIEDLKFKDTFLDQFKVNKVVLKNGINIYYNQNKNQLIDFYSYEKDNEVNYIGNIKDGKLYIDTSSQFVEKKINEVISKNKLKDIIIQEEQQVVLLGKQKIPIVSFMYGILK